MPFAEMMRPRSIGTSLDARGGRERLDELREALRSADGMSRKIEGRRLRRQFGGELLAQIGVDLDDRHQKRDAEAERQHDRRRQRAGRWMLAIAMRSAIRRACGRRRSNRHQQRARPAEAARRCRAAAADVDDRDAPVVGEQHGKRRQAARWRPQRHSHVARARPSRQRRDLVTKQRADRHVMCAAERPQRERKRGEQAIDQRESERRRIERRIDRQRKNRTER